MSKFQKIIKNSEQISFNNHAIMKAKWMTNSQYFVFFFNFSVLSIFCQQFHHLLNTSWAFPIQGNLWQSQGLWTTVSQGEVIFFFKSFLTLAHAWHQNFSSQFFQRYYPTWDSLFFHIFEFHNKFWWFLCVKKITVKRKVCSLFMMIFWNFDIKKSQFLWNNFRTHSRNFDVFVYGLTLGTGNSQV